MAVSNCKKGAKALFFFGGRNTDFCPKEHGQPGRTHGLREDLY